MFLVQRRWLTVDQHARVKARPLYRVRTHFCIGSKYSLKMICGDRSVLFGCWRHEFLWFCRFWGEKTSLLKSELGEYAFGIIRWQVCSLSTKKRMPRPTSFLSCGIFAVFRLQLGVQSRQSVQFPELCNRLAIYGKFP